MAETIRRTQAERSAITRQVLLHAAIKCLFEHGYGSTTTIMVAEIAGVSRGAMLHQFPSKADLMAFVVEADFEEEVELYKELLSGIDEPRKRLLAYPEAAWKILSRPSGVAVLEILQGSRSDQALREKLAPVLARIEVNARDTLNREFPGGLSVPLLKLTVGLVRGLSVMQVMSPEDEDVTDAIRLLQQLLQAGIDTGVLSGKSIGRESGREAGSAAEQKKPTSTRKKPRRSPAKQAANDEPERPDNSK